MTPAMLADVLTRFVPHPRVCPMLADPVYRDRIVWQATSFVSIALPSVEAPQAICGISSHLGVGEAWMLAGAGFNAQVRRILPMQRQLVRHGYAALGLVRLHMLVDADWPQAARYARALGFVREFDRPARGLGYKGRDVDFYIFKPVEER